MEADWLASRMPGDLLDQRQPLPEEAEEDSSEVLDFSVFADTGLDFEDLFNSEDLFGPDSAHYRAEDFSQLVTVQPDTSNNNVKLLANQAASSHSNSITGEAKSETLLGTQEELAVATGTQQQQQSGEQCLAKQQQLCLQQAQKNVLPAVAEEASSFRKLKSPRDSAATTAQPRTDTLDGGGGAVAPRSSAAAPGRISNFGGKRAVLPLIFPKPAAASVALVEAMRPAVTTGHQFTPIAPAPPRYTCTTNPGVRGGEGGGG